MKDKKLLVFIVTEVEEIEGYNKSNPNELCQWPWSYCDGKLEEDYAFDVTIFNKPIPQEKCYLLAKASNDKDVESKSWL